MEPSRLIPLSLWRLIVTVCVGMLLVAGAGAWYTRQAIAAEDAKVRQAISAEGRIQCGIYTLLDTAYRQTPPATAAGRNFAAAIHKVVADLGCEEK